ncbi:MAG: hypothetical protein WAT39_11385 [Planctomycetota bacterium]
MRLRVIRHEPAEAAWNMAVDEALLRRGGEPTLRLYGWRPHAVSLGWFQRLADFADLPPGTPIVRRLTGGGAIHHGDEITFSLTLDAHLLPRDIAASYRLLHDAVVEALAEHGIAAERLGAGAPQEARPAQRWCFAAPGRDDVVTVAGKLLGSAQRRIRNPDPRVLHHGSLVLRRPALTPFVAAAADSGAVDEAGLRSALVAQVSRALGVVPFDGELTAVERSLAQQLVSDYRDPAFTGARGSRGAARHQS